ncbi:hypothetical protein C0995_009837 [Termitomyces sp. Mi166|nr:hypothetical protein C0995_009837 [Termitomyces sp. Mi166\
MPAFRNVKTHRSSGKIWNNPAIAYDENGWEIPPHADILLNIPTHNELPSPHSSATSPSVASVDSDMEAYPARRSKGKAKARHPSDSDHVPRPKNAFILFRSYFYQTCGGSDQNQISVNAGKVWKALSDEQKKPFQLAADREKQEHQARFPHYTYSPGSKLDATRRKNSPVKKKKAQPSAKKSLVIPPAVCRDYRRPSRVKVEPAPVDIPLHSLALSSRIVPEVEENAIQLANSDAVPQSASVFSANWSFETAFVPTSEIPPLELSPVKSEKEENKDKAMKGLKPSSSLRPPNFDTSNKPCLNPQPPTVDSYLDTESFPNVHYDYNNKMFDQLLNSSNSYALTSSSSEFETWDLNNSSYFGPLELDFSALDNEDLVMGGNKNSKPSLFPLLTTGPSGISVYLSSPFDDCEMDQYVDYGLVAQIYERAGCSRPGYIEGNIIAEIFSTAAVDLPPSILSAIWDLVDESKSGYISETGVVIALRLIGWAQNGEKVTINLAKKNGPSPRIKGLTEGCSNPLDWPPFTESIRDASQKLFEEYGPVYGLLEGNKARDAFLVFDLAPKDIWKIWDVADTRKRGALDRHDFALAIYLIHCVQTGRLSTIPPATPPQVYEEIRSIWVSPKIPPPSPQILNTPVRPRKPTRLPPPLVTASCSKANPVISPRSAPAVTNAENWDVSPSAKATAEQHFDKLDTSKVGYIEGDVVAKFMRGFELVPEDLALIW